MLTETPNRPAADRAEAPPDTAAATRSRKSPEYGAGISSPNDMLRHQRHPSALICKAFSLRINLFGNRSNYILLGRLLSRRGFRQKRKPPESDLNCRYDDRDRHERAGLFFIGP